VEALAILKDQVAEPKNGWIIGDPVLKPFLVELRGGSSGKSFRVSHT
jgi:hypothetical protein